tara:strand:- start:616 stop:1083 length:468 start_codon:yes stop_codon:yes gene_type:complete
MEFLLYLNSLEKEIIEIITKVDYSIEENTPLCLIDSKFFGFLKKNQKRIVICTENAKIHGGSYFPRTNTNDNYIKTGLYIRKALRHEAVHIAQACNKGNLVKIEGMSKVKLNRSKLEALEASTSISGKRDKEYEAYALEDKPRLVIKALKKYCLS